MKKRILKKSLVISIMLLFIGIGIVPSTGTIDIKQSTVANLDGDTLYVGGGGSGNYTKIQDAIDDASDGDTNQDIKHLNIYENNLTFYFADTSITYTKNKENGYIYFNKHVHVHARGYGLLFDADTEDITMKLIMNYTAILNYSAIGNKLYHVLRPLIAFGIREKNYTDYKWESFKLKRHGNEIKEGNFSIEFTIETKNIQPGDEIIIKPEIYIIGDPLLRISNESIKTSWILRLAYTFTIFNKIILHNKILPQYAPDSYIGGPTFILYFH